MLSCDGRIFPASAEERAHWLMPRFVHDPHAIMSEARESNAVFSGGQVLRFVSRGGDGGVWDADDLDVYCALGSGRRMVALFELEGYQAEVLPAGEGFDRPYVDESSISCVARMRRGDDRHVDVVVSTCHSALAPIAHFYATHVVNVVTASTICVAYPDSTLKRRGFFRPWAARTWNRVLATEKYEQRGYQILGFLRNREAGVWDGTISKRFYCPHVERCFMDEGTLRLWYAEVDGDRVRAKDCDLLRGVTWTWGGHQCMCCIRSTGQKVVVAMTAVDDAGASFSLSSYVQRR